MHSNYIILNDNFPMVTTRYVHVNVTRECVIKVTTTIVLLYRLPAWHKDREQMNGIVKNEF